MDGLLAAAQHRRVAALHAERRGVRRHVRARLVNDRDDAQRHMYALDFQPVRPPPDLAAAERVGKLRQLHQRRGDPLDARRRQPQTVEHRLRNAVDARRAHIRLVGGEELVRAFPKILRHFQNRPVARFGVGLRQRGGSLLRQCAFFAYGHKAALPFFTLFFRNRCR